MRPKDLLIRTATDVRKYGASHSGSVLKVPQQTVGGVGTPMWQAWTPRVAFDGTYLDPSHYHIYHCYYTFWGNVIVWYAWIEIDDYEGRARTQMSFDKPTSVPPFFSSGDGSFGLQGYYGLIPSLIVNTNGTDTVFYVTLHNGSLDIFDYPTWYPIRMFLSGIGILDPSFSMPV
jgi:hypothetical protein